jgi:Helix-turn-helix domain, rpiR family
VASPISWKKSIRASLATFSPAMRRIGEFVLDNPDETALAPLRVLASRVGSPPSAFTRFSQSLGYTGFRQLQLVLKSEVFARSGGAHAELARRRTTLVHHGLPSEMTDTITGRAMEIEAVAGELSSAALAQAANIIAASDCVALAHDEMGMIPAAFLAKLLSDQGFIVGLRAVADFMPPRRIPLVALLLSAPAHSEAPIERRLRSNDRAILISCKGREDMGVSSLITLPTPTVPRSRPIVAAVVVVELLAARVASIRRPRLPEADFDPVGW